MTATVHPTTSIAPHLIARQKLARTALTGLNLDAILLIHPGDLNYVSGFTGHDSIGVLTLADFVLITDSRYTEQAQIEAGWLRTIQREGKMSAALTTAIEQLKPKRIGFEANFTTFGQIDALKKALAEKLIAAELVPVDDVMVKIRAVKDAVEVGIIKDAIRVAQDALLAMKADLKPGPTENEVAGRLVYEMRKRGASDASFEPIVGTGANSSLPHYRPGDISIANDTFLLIDYGARYKGYCSDITRTYSLGKIPAKLQEIYKVCLEANQAAIALLAPGVTNRQADNAARSIIEKAGYGKQFGHGLGHGIGLDIHEQPTLGKSAPESPLQPGMIVTVEPGIYLPGLGGVRIEDDVLITETGHEVLTSLDKSFEGCCLR